LNQSEHSNAGVCDANTEEPSNRRHQQVFDHQLLDQPATSGTDRQAQSHLACADGSPARQEASDVGAGHKQDHGSKRREHCNHHGIGSILRHPGLQLRAHG
jgi:hypothetical protein